MNLKGRDFLTLRDFTGEEIQYIVDLGLDLKDKLKKGIPHPYLQGKSLAMIFQKSSTRTRVSFEVGMYQLGGQALFLSTRDLQIGRGEPCAGHGARAVALCRRHPHPHLRAG